MLPEKAAADATNTAHIVRPIVARIAVARREEAAESLAERGEKRQKKQILRHFELS